MLKSTKWLVGAAFVALALPAMAADTDAKKPAASDAKASTTALTPEQKKQVQENTATENRPTAMTKEEAKASKAKKGAAPLSPDQAKRVEATKTESRPTAMSKEEVKASKEKGRTQLTTKEKEELAKKNASGS